MQTPHVVETPGLLEPLDGDPFLIGLGGSPRTPLAPSSPEGARTATAVARDTKPVKPLSRLES